MFNNKKNLVPLKVSSSCRVSFFSSHRRIWFSHIRDLNVHTVWFVWPHICVIVMSVMGCLIVLPFQEGAAGRAKGIQEEKGTEESAEDERAGTRERGPEIQMAAVQQ